jgi:nucleoside-diphosphate-sugar epimerase
METVCLRYFNIFGPRQAPDSPYSGVIAKLALQMLRHSADPASPLTPGTQPTLHGDGEQTRDFTYIDNVVSANLLALAAPPEKVSGRVFNIATGQRHSLNQTFRLLAQLTGYPAPPRYTEPRAGDVRDSLADISAARASVGYQPLLDFEEGLARTVAWYRDQLARLTPHNPTLAGAPFMARSPRDMGGETEAETQLNLPTTADRA